MVASIMDALLADLGAVADKIIYLVGEVGDAIVGIPILLLTTGILFLGGVIGIFGRLLSTIKGG